MSDTKQKKFKNGFLPEGIFRMYLYNVHCLLEQHLCHLAIFSVVGGMYF